MTMRVVLMVSPPDNEAREYDVFGGDGGDVGDDGDKNEMM